MANRITMSICGEDYTLVADESAAYMEKVGALVDEKMTQLQEGAGRTHFSRAAGEKADSFPASEQYRYYAKLIVHWRLKRQKERSDESGKH